MSEIHAELRTLSGQMLDTVFARYEVLCFMMWVKKRRYLICITIARNWRLHMDLSTHLLAVHSACSRRWRFLGIAKLPQTLNPFFLLWDYNYIVLSLVLGLNILRLVLELYWLQECPNPRHLTYLGNWKIFYGHSKCQSSVINSKLRIFPKLQNPSICQ